MKPKLIVLAFVAILAFSVLVGVGKCQGTTLSIDPPSATLTQDQIGTIYQVTINITNVTGLWSWVLRLNWNSQVLNFSSSQEGPFMKNVGSTVCPPPNVRTGYIFDLSSTLMTPYSNPTASGSGVLYIVNFMVVGPGQSNITLNETSLSGFNTGAISYSVEGGQVTVLPEFPQVALFISVFAAATILLAVQKTRNSRRKKVTLELSLRN